MEEGEGSNSLIELPLILRQTSVYSHNSFRWGDEEKESWDLLFAPL